MGFIPNDGDIILDAVLTDAGRERLARGDGSFTITKFAVGDDEINYELYNKDNPNGSAYYDLNILQTPVFEAVTDNGSALKHKLISIPRSDLLYLPILKVNEVFDAATARRTSGGSVGTFVVPVNKDTEDSFKPENGILLGANPDSGGGRIRIDQGLDTTEISPNRTLDDNLIETRYIVEMDNRFGSVVSANGQVRANPSYVDDDDIAAYSLALGSDLDFVKRNSERNTSEGQTIAGPRGTIIEFKIQASLDLNSSTFFFTQLGKTGTITDRAGASLSIYYIDSIVRVFGATTGRSVDIPVRYIRKQ